MTKDPNQERRKKTSRTHEPMKNPRKKDVGKGQKGRRVGPGGRPPSREDIERRQQLAMEQGNKQGRKSLERAEGAGKMPDGFNMKRPAEKLGYIQKLGAARMSPGHKGDMTAMKMMHGDAAAKYYDGAGMYMNGAPKYEGASKSYMGPMRHVAGHDDRPSYTKQTTTTKVVPGSESSTSTSSSGGSSQSKTKLEKAKSSGSKTKKSDSDYMTSLSKNKKFSGRTGAEMAEAGHISKAKIGEYDKIAGTSSSGGSTSSKSTTSKSTKPTVKTTVEKNKVTSKRKSGAQVMSEGREAEMNRAGRQKAGMEEMLNIAKRDSANIAQSYLKGKQITPKTLQRAVKLGNKEGRKVLRGYGDDMGSFGQQGRGMSAEFRYSQDATNKAFPEIGVATGTSIGKGKGMSSGKVRKFEPGQEFQLHSQNYNPSDIGKVKNFSKKGQYKITDVKTDAGTAGSYGGYSSAKEYMDSMGLSAGSPKMPKGPMKFGMRK